MLENLCVMGKSVSERLHRLRILGSVRMFGTTVDLEFAVNRTAKTIVRDHSLDGAFNKKFGAALTALTEGFGFVSPDKARETHIGLLSLLFTADLDVGGIDDNDEVTCVNMGCENGLMLAAEQVCSLHGNMAKVLVLGVDYPPLAFYLGGFCGKSTHSELGKGWRD